MGKDYLQEQEWLKGSYNIESPPHPANMVTVTTGTMELTVGLSGSPTGLSVSLGSLTGESPQQFLLLI